MGKRLTETLVGVFIVVGIIVFIILYAWLAGKIGLRNTHDITVYFDDVTGLKVGDPVMIYGLEKGKVKSLQINRNGVVMILAIDRDFIIPADSKISIRSVSYLGSDKYVQIVPGKSLSASAVYYGKNETLDLEAIGIQLDTLMTTLRNFKIPDFDKIAVNLSSEFGKIGRQLSEMLEGPSDRIENLAVRLDSLSKLLNEEGTVGKLLKSDEFYQEVRETNQALKDLIKDVKENPKKYVTIKVF